MKMNSTKTHLARTLAKLAFAMALICQAYAQNGFNLDVNWSTINGGGGICAGGQFSLSGSVGQPGAGASHSVDFGLFGGFWAADAVLPALRVMRLGPNLIYLAWPSWADNYELQSTDNLGPHAIWTAIASAPVQFGGEYAVAVAMTKPKEFFRLKQVNRSNPQ